MRRVLFVSQYSYPHDEEIRLTRVARSLCESGWEVTVCCPAGRLRRSEIQREDLEWDIRSPRWTRLFAATNPLNLLWYVWLANQARLVRPDVVIVRNLRLALPGLMAARLQGAVGIADLSEHYPAMVRELSRSRLRHLITRSPWIVGGLERLAVGLSDWVWVVEATNGERLRSAHPSRKISVVRNLPEIGTVHSARPTREATRRTRFVYVGIIDRFRGLDVFLSALVEALGQIEGRVEAVIAGDGPQRARLEALASRLGLDDFVRFEGWCSGARKADLLASSDVGILTHVDSELTRSTQPNKLFEYMAAGLPVLATDIPPIARVVREWDCGFLVDCTPHSVATGVLSVLDDPEQAAERGRNGVRAVRSRLNWQREFGDIRGLLDELTGKVECAVDSGP